MMANITLFIFSESYWELHKWSIDNYAKFIEELWHFFEIISSEPYKEVKISYRMIIFYFICNVTIVHYVITLQLATV